MCDGQHQVRGSDAFAQFTVHLEAHHVGQQHVHGLAKHYGFGLDTAYSPAHHTQPIDHGGMRVGADQSIREGHQVGIGCHSLLVQCRETSCCDHIGKVFKIDLVNDTRHGRDDSKVAESILSPFEELIAFAVALELDLRIAL